MAMVQTKRLAALLLALLLTLFLLPSAWADSGVVGGTTVSGTVRVYLSSISSLTAVDVSIAGSYSVGGDASRALARGQNIRVSNSGGTLMMTADGQTQTMGSRFKLRRHQTSGENGVRIAQARYPASLYPGDIEFIAKGGNVQIIVHVYMEDYMLGVLPYEMDNSFPLEALKAQAVAARTYALKKMSAQAATYDVVDTTSDQVYNGTPSGNARCAQAVQETSNIVGTVNGEYMASYYTASNGGQTESVKNAWGSGSYSYLQVKDDPYDLRKRRFHRQIGHVLSRRHDQRFRTDRVASHGGGDARRRGQRADHGHQRRDAGRTEVRRTFPRIHQGAGRPDACGVRRRDGDAGLLFPGRGALLPVHQRAEKRDADRDGGCRRL